MNDRSILHRLPPRVNTDLPQRRVEEARVCQPAARRIPVDAWARGEGGGAGGAAGKAFKGRKKRGHYPSKMSRHRRSIRRKAALFEIFCQLFKYVFCQFMFFFKVLCLLASLQARGISICTTVRVRIASIIKMLYISSLVHAS